MPYDDALAGRVRTLVEAHDGIAVTEKRMFGGLAFLVGGHMAVCASHEGGLLVRVDPDESAELVATTAAAPMEMRGRPMAGWLRVPADQVATDDDLRPWVERGVAHAGSLPAK